ncbi:MAG: hypothetical protein R6V01_02975 [Thermoplasmatota archaeon]
MDRIKSEVLRKLEAAVSRDLVDEDVIPLLDILNGFEEYVTTSSCSGRMQLISVPGPGDKRGSKVIGKWHRKVDSRKVLDAVDRWDGEGELHFMVQPLLVHVRCRDMAAAVRLRNIAHGTGPKLSTIRSVKLDAEGEPARWGTVVEIMGTERMEVPIDGMERVHLERYLKLWVEKGHDLMDRTKRSIPRLMEEMPA